MNDDCVDSNWCPDCGEPRGVCRCEEYRAADALVEELDDWGDSYTDQDAENHICPKCHGSGIWIDDIEPCPHCDGLGYEWWLP